MRQHFHAARRGSQSAYKAKTATPDCNQRVRVHRNRCRFKLATLKAVFSGERLATLNAESDARKTRDVRRVSQRRDSAGVVYHREAADFFFARLTFQVAQWESRGRDGREACQGGYLPHNI